MAITENTLPPTVALAGNPMWVGLETDEFAEDFIGLHLDPEVYLDGAWESASQETRHELDRDHKVVVDVSDILKWDPVKEFSFPDINLLVKRNDLRRQWRLFRSEKYGTPLVEYNDTYASGTRYILPGKISDIKQGQINDYYSNWWTKLRFEKFFLTNSPRIKKTDASAEERLYYLVFGTSVTSINLKVKVYYSEYRAEFHLPSQDELLAMDTNLRAEGVGGFEAVTYYTSSEASATEAIGINSAGTVVNVAKFQLRNSRPSRTFTASAGDYSLRDRGPAGGWIYYIDGTKYWEAYKEDLPAAAWSNVTGTFIGTTGTAIGTGAANTAAIIAQEGHTASAAQDCNDIENKTLSKETISSVSRFDVYEIVLSYKSLQLAHATKVVSKYEVWIEDQDDNVISEVFTFKFDSVTREDARYYIFRNALGMYEGARLTGVSEDSDDIDFTTALRKRAKDYSASDMVWLKEFVKEVHNVKAYSSWLNEDELAWIRELLLSREVYEVVDGVLRPILITTSSVQLNKTDSNLRAINLDYIYGIDSVPDVPNAAYYPQQFVHETDQTGSNVNLFWGSRGTPIYHYNNKTYIVFQQRQESGYDSRASIFAYNHTTGVYSANYDLKATGDVTGVTDHHPMPSVIVADDGHIVVAQELVRLGTGNHNDVITIKRSDNVEDETSWVNAKAKTAGYWTFIGTWQPDNSQRLAYPFLCKDNAGNIYCITRRYTSGGRYVTIHKSADHGVTWDAGHDIVDSGNTAIWIYPERVSGGTSDILRICITQVDKTGAGADVYRNVFYLESDDGGVTWRDVSNSFSKDTVASGAITLAELENAAYDFVVIEAAADTPHDNVLSRSACVDDSGNVYLITREWSAGTDYDYRLVYWDGSAWQKNLVTDGTASALSSVPTIIHRKDYIFDIFYEETEGVLSQFRTSDLSNWEKIRTVKSYPGLTTHTFSSAAFTTNFKDTNNWMLISTYGADAAYSDIFCEVTDGRYL